jgi:hypothetical protein
MVGRMNNEEENIVREMLPLLPEDLDIEENNINYNFLIPINWDIEMNLVPLEENIEEDNPPEMPPQLMRQNAMIFEDIENLLIEDNDIRVPIFLERQMNEANMVNNDQGIPNMEMDDNLEDALRMLWRRMFGEEMN